MKKTTGIGLWKSRQQNIGDEEKKRKKHHNPQTYSQRQLHVNYILRHKEFWSFFYLYLKQSPRKYCEASRLLPKPHDRTVDLT